MADNEELLANIRLCWRKRKSSLARDELLIEYMLAEALRRTGKCLAKLHDLYAERILSVPECKSMYLHSIKRDALSAVARLEDAVFRWGDHITH